MARKPWKQQSFGERLLTWLEYDFAERHEKSIQALVYFGAALLVIIVGLRGLGDLSNLSYMPKFLLNPEGKIDSNFVMIGLLVEFTMTNYSEAYISLLITLKPFPWEFNRKQDKEL